MLTPGTFALTLLLSFLTALGPLSMDMYLPSLPDIARALHAPIIDVQLTISSYLFGFAVGQNFLRADLRPPRPQTDFADGAGTVRRRQRRLRLSRNRSTH